MRKVQTNDIQAQVGRQVSRLMLIIVVSLTAILTTQSLILSYRAHESACEVLKAKIPEYLGPIGRELALGDRNVAGQIFEEFKKTLSKGEVHASLSLVNDFKSNAPICKATIFGADVAIPVTFGSNKVAEVRGSILSSPGLVALGFLLLILSIVIFVVQRGVRALTNWLELFVIEPIIKLSAGTSLESDRQLPEEVLKVSQNLERLRSNLIEEQNRTAQLAHAEKLGVFAAQVAHDIKSPLSALESLESDQGEFTEEKRRLLRLVTQRIRHISDVLLTKDIKSKLAPADLLMIAPGVFEAIAAEKRLILGNSPIKIRTDISVAAIGKFVPLSQIEVGRVLSNLIDNSIEALKDRDGLSNPGIDVKVVLNAKNASVEIVVVDNGAGISAERIPLLGSARVSFRENGHGLGLFHAKESTERVRGSFSIQSKLGLGTEVAISLPISTEPKWFSGHLPAEKNFCVLDDDPTIFEAWRQALPNSNFRFFSSETGEFVAQTTKSDAFFLIDYQLGQDCLNGIEVIKKHSIEKRAFLVTSRSDDVATQNEALAAGIRIFPKSLILSQRKILLEPIHETSRLDHLALIDDSPLVRAAWGIVAEKKKIKLTATEDLDSFLAADLPLETPIFIDYQLKETVGFVVSQELFKRGYRNLNLVTGYPANHFAKVPPEIRTIRGKEFPEDIGV